MKAYHTGILQTQQGCFPIGAIPSQVGYNKGIKVFYKGRKNMRTRVHFIAPYESMIPIIQECIPRFPQLTIQTDVGDLANGVELATQAEKNGAEIIISRGGTAQLIKKQ